MEIQTKKKHLDILYENMPIDFTPSRKTYYVKKFKEADQSRGEDEIDNIIGIMKEDGII